MKHAAPIGSQMPTPDRYIATSSVPVSAQQAFAYHERTGALRRLIPPWESVSIEHSDDSLLPGSKVVLTNRLLGIPLRWHAEHTEYDPPNMFADTQASGPFKQWDHRHLFQSRGEDQCLIRDELTYRVPMGALGRLLGGGLVKQKIESMFSFRHHVVNSDLDLWQRYDQSPLRIAISGSTGLLGRQLCCMLTLFGHEVHRIVRSTSGDDDSIAAWSDDEAEIQKLNGFDVVLHLAGKPIADGRWTEKFKQEIRDSRLIKTRQLCERLASLSEKPKVLVCASATGLYGDRGDDAMDESCPAGEGFLPDLCKEWEASTAAASNAGIRVVNARIGIVLSPKGGALQKMLTPAKLLGGKLGSGKQWWSWIGFDDAIGALYHCMQTPSLSGPVNLVAPEPVTNREFVKTLGNVIRRPAIFPAPAFMLRLVLGEMADALLLDSTRVMPQRLAETGYQFRHSGLRGYLRYCLGYDRLESIE